MNWSDVFYPGNPERRENLIRKNQELQELMKNNFRATNQLIEVLKTHLGLSFSRVNLNDKATVKENCDVLIQRIREIQAEVEKIDEKLKEKLEPTLYEKLKMNNLSIPECKKVSVVLCGIQCIVTTIAATHVLGWVFKSVQILTSITGICGIISKGLISCVVFGVLFMGIDMIIQAIQGSYERNELEKALKEYEEVLEKFRPASEEYQDSITEVKLSIKMLKGKN